MSLRSERELRLLNDAWPWTGTLRGYPLSVADLIERATLTPEAAATLAWTIQHGASVFVAAGPPGAGKSTVANALLEFLPHDAHVYVTAGAWDDVNVPPVEGPVYLLVNELSGHMPVYLSGRAAHAAFSQLNDAVRIFGTLHARSAGEALRVMCYEAGLPRSAFSWQGQQIVRRVVELGFLPPAGDLVLLTDPGAGAAALAAWQYLSEQDVADQIAAHAARLRT